MKGFLNTPNHEFCTEALKMLRTYHRVASGRDQRLHSARYLHGQRSRRDQQLHCNTILRVNERAPGTRLHIWLGMLSSKALQSLT
jgi:hypothetical protein